MLRPRVIPCLLIKARGLVKTVRFANPKYVGDPINAVRIFNEKSVDELVVLDIDATRDGREPDYATIERLAGECRMPLCYGGGVKSVEQARRIVSFGVEKVAIGSAAALAPSFVTKLAESLGVQSVVSVLDVRKAPASGLYRGWIGNGLISTHRRAVDLASELERYGTGEIFVNAIESDGMMTGYDLALARQIRSVISVPLTVGGGAGSLADIRELISAVGIVGAAVGSLFVFKGVHKAVLINYPSSADRDALTPVGA